MPKNTDTQQVWITHSYSLQNGYFVWSVLEYMGTPTERELRHLILLRDGTYVAIDCFHSWREETILEWSTPLFNQEIIQI